MKKISLKDELHALDLYLGLEQVRFDDRLRIQLDIEDDAYEALVPSMILQPLIENAVKHATALSEAGGHISIAGKTDDAMLYLSVADTGPGRSARAKSLPRSEDSVGLADTRERLRVLYGDTHTFNVSDIQPHGLRVEISIPHERRDK